MKDGKFNKLQICMQKVVCCENETFKINSQYF